jgi:hypothetical protein
MQTRRLRCDACRALLQSQADERLLACERWRDTGLVFTTHLGAALDAGNIRKMFKRVCEAAGIGGPHQATVVRSTMRRSRSS